MEPVVMATALLIAFSAAVITVLMHASPITKFIEFPVPGANCRL